jgi:hypothetical protein
VAVGRTREEAERKSVETIAGMPVSGHPLVISSAIFRHRCTIVLCKPLEHVDEDNVWFVEAPLLEGGAYSN